MIQPYKLETFVYASSQEEIDQLQQDIRQFIEDHRNEGRAVTASKVSSAIKKWRDNAIVRNSIIRFFE